MRLWFWGQWGSAPNVIGSYHPTTVRLLGSVNIGRAYVTLRDTLLTYRPRVVGRHRSGISAFVAVQGEAAGLKSVRVGYDLRLVGSTWLIAHDTLLEGALPDVIAAASDPVAGRTNHPAVYLKRGKDLADRFRALFPQRPSPGTRRPAVRKKAGP